jgi:hypothetical protein
MKQGLSVEEHVGALNIAKKRLYQNLLIARAMRTHFIKIHEMPTRD